MPNNRIQSFQVDQNELGAALGGNPNLQQNISHTNIQDIGTNTHAQIDSHISDTSIHFSVINGLSDVSVPSPSNGQVLTFNNVSGNWEAVTPTDNDVAAVWGNITGTLSNQTDLQNALNAKTDNSSFNAHVNDTSIHFSVINGLSDVNINLGSPISDDNVLTYDTGTSAWVNKTLSSLNKPSGYFVDVDTAGGTITVNSLPSGWSATYVGVGNFTITHNLNNANIGLSVSVYYNGGGRNITPTSITTSAVTFQINDLADVAVEGNVVGMLMI